MTFLGKILAFLNLALSIAVAGFILATYASRANWHAAYESMKKQEEVSRRDAEAFKAEMVQAQSERLKSEKAVEEHRALAKKEKDALDGRITDLSEKLKQAGEENAKHVASQTAAGEELNRRAKEVDYLKRLIGERDQDLARQKKQVVDMQAMMVEATINYRAERERNERLLQENERLTKDNRQMQQVASSTSLRREAPKKNPPAEDIEGRVKATDPSGYIKVSVGSDAGLSKGNTLEVYRLKPEPAYLGTIQIVQVSPSEAVAKPLVEPRGHGSIQVGDQVSSSILHR